MQTDREGGLLVEIPEVRSFSPRPTADKGRLKRLTLRVRTRQAGGTFFKGFRRGILGRDRSVPVQGQTGLALIQGRFRRRRRKRAKGGRSGVVRR
jgi:hypothetical protein